MNSNLIYEYSGISCKWSKDKSFNQPILLGQQTSDLGKKGKTEIRKGEKEVVFLYHSFLIQISFWSII